MKNAKKVSHTAFWRAQHEHNQNAVLFFTGMNLEELVNLKMDMGKEWLTKHLRHHGFTNVACEEIWKERKVLQWWNLNWRQYDHWTILPFLHKVTEGERYNVYKDMHSNVFRESHPENLALQEQLSGVLDIITATPTEKEEVNHAA